MSQQNGQPPGLIVLLALRQPPWFGEVSQCLYRAGYRVYKATTTLTAWNMLQSQRPDSIVACANEPECRDFFRTIVEQAHLLHRPLLVLLSEQAPQDDDNCDFADMTLPPIPGYLCPQLRACLRLRAENIALRQGQDEVNLLKNAIVRNVSHELKTPLLHVKSAVALLAEDLGQTKLIDYATGATARLEALVKHITQLGGTLDINLGPVLVREVVDQAIRNLRRRWERKDAMERIRVNVPEHLSAVLGDAQSLSTALELLLDNALKFSEDVVEVSAYPSDGNIKIEVRDHGIGIAKDKLEVIFDSFYQANSSSTRRYGGIGVGLAIVRLILDRHNVQIAVESQEGQGSLFSFSLPLAEVQQQSAAVQHAS